MTREFYGATVAAQTSINELLSLPASGREQDWEIELADPDRIEEMLKAGSMSDLHYEEKCALALLIVASIEESVNAGDINPNTLERAKAAFKRDDDVREAMIFYWLDQGRSSNEAAAREILSV
jgi:hypothetical protein